MKKYICKFPGCMFETYKKSEIDIHHLLPKSMGGNNHKSNLITLCPNHHRNIFVPYCTHGIHSIKTDNSIILEGILASTKGKVLKFIRCSDTKTYTYFLETKQIYEW